MCSRCAQDYCLTWLQSTQNALHLTWRLSFAICRNASEQSWENRLRHAEDEAKQERKQREVLQAQASILYSLIILRNGDYRWTSWPSAMVKTWLVNVTHEEILTLHKGLGFNLSDCPSLWHSYILVSYAMQRCHKVMLNSAKFAPAARGQETDVCRRPRQAKRITLRGGKLFCLHKWDVQRVSLKFTWSARIDGYSPQTDIRLAAMWLTWPVFRQSMH